MAGSPRARAARKEPLYPNSIGYCIKKYGYTRSELAEEIGIDRKTLYLYCTGQLATPKYTLEKIARTLGCPLEELRSLPQPIKLERRADSIVSLSESARDTMGVGEGQIVSLQEWHIGGVQGGVPSFPKGTSITEISRDWATWFGLKLPKILRMISLWSDPAYCKEVQTMVDQEIRVMDETLEQHQGQQEEQVFSRRQALVAIAALPLALLTWRSGPIVDTVSPEFLSQCAASITACWHLLRGRGGLSAVDEIVPQFTPLLKTLAQHPSQYQKTAASLAAQASLLQGILAMHRLNVTDRVTYCKDAIRYASIGEDNNLRAAALTYLGYTYSFCSIPRQPEKAIQVFQEAQHILFQDALLKCNISMGLAEAYAQCGEEQQALYYIDFAQTSFPAYPEQDPSYIFGDCSLHVLYQWEGKMYLELSEHFSDRGYQRRASDALLKGIGIQSISDRSTAETIIYQADAARVLEELDSYATFLGQAAQMAIDLGSRKRYNEALQVYEKTPEKWFHERRMQALAKDVFRHLPGRR